jgi:hypothetical protein
LEPAEGLRVRGNVIGQELEGDETAEFQVFGFVDYAHTTAAKFLDNAVVRNGLAYQAASPFTCTPAHFSSRVRVAA